MGAPKKRIEWLEAQVEELDWWKWFFTDHLGMFKTRQEMVAYRYCEGRYMLLKVGIPRKPSDGIQLSGDVLDLGCGAISIFEKRRGIEVLAIDPLLKPMLLAPSLKSFVRLGRVETCVYRSWSIENVLDRQFDYVWCYNMLDHVADWRETLWHCHRVLRSGGVLLLGTDVRKNHFQDEKDKMYHVSVFSREQLFQQLKDLGFTIEWKTREKKLTLYRVGLRGKKDDETTGLR